jgi:GTPase SAR1 family protein
MEPRNLTLEIKHLPDAFGKKDAEPSEAQRKALGYLAAGDYKQAKLEMLTNKRAQAKIFSIAYSYEGRLLLVRNNGWLVLEDVPNHRYDLARFMNPKVLARFLKRRDEVDEFDRVPMGAVQFAPLSAEELADLPPAPTTAQHASADVTFKPVVYLNNQFVSLSDAQKKLLTHLQNENAKALLHGPAGAGKTSLLWQVLVDGLQQNVSHFVCLTQNPFLINYWRDQADSSPVLSAREEGDCDWLFATPVNWLKELCPELANKKEVGEEECTDWIKHYLRAHKNDNIPETITQRVLEIYTEFRNLSGYVDDQASYLQLNELNCLFHERNEKLFLLKLYAAYLTEIKRQQDTFDPNFHRIENIEQVADIFQGETTYLIDEGQELSTLLAKQIIRIAKGRVIISYDDHQRRSDSNSKRFFYQRQMGEGVELFGLPVSFRCRPHVTAFLNRLIQLKFKLSGGKSDEYEASGIASATEETDVAEIPVETNTANIPALKAKYPRTSTVIITLPVHENEAREKFKGYEVYTYKNLAGLEFNNTILFKCFGLPIMREINKILAGLSPTARVNSANLAKHFDPTFILVLNGLFVAASRSLGDIAIVEKELGPIRHLIVELLPHVALLLEKKHGNELTSPPLFEEKIDYQLLLQRAKQLLYQGDPGGQVSVLRQQLPPAEQKELRRYQANLEKVRGEKQAAAEKAKDERLKKRLASEATSVLKDNRKQTNDRDIMIRADVSPENLELFLKRHGLKPLVERRNQKCALIEILNSHTETPLHFLSPLILDLMAPELLLAPSIVNPGELEITLLSSLLPTRPGREFLFLLLDRRPDLVARITLKDLLRRTFTDGNLSLASYTFLGAGDIDATRSVLSTVINKNESFMNDVIATLRSNEPERQNDKALVYDMLYAFYFSEFTLPFLVKLMFADSNLLADMPYRQGNVQRVIDELLTNNISQNLIILHNLVQTDRRARAFLANVGNLCGIFINTTPPTCRFQLLQAIPGGRRILEELMRHYPALTFDEIQLALHDAGLPFIVYPRIYKPEEFDRIEQFVGNLLSLNQPGMNAFLESPDAERLLFGLYTTGYSLFYTVGSLSSFADTFLGNPNYLSRLPIEKMLERSAHSSGQTRSCFTHLFFTGLGSPLLALLGDHWNETNQLRKASPAAFLEPAYHKPGLAFIPFHAMLIDKNLHKFLLFLVRTNDSFVRVLVEKIKKEMLDKTESLTIIAISCYYPELLGALINRWNQLEPASVITFFELFKICPQQRLLFHWMAKCPLAHPLLNDMTNNAEALPMLLPVTQLGLEMMRSQRNEESSNALVWLAQTPTGRSALLNLFHADTGNIKFLATEKVMCKKLIMSANLFHMKNALEILSSSDRDGFLCVFHFIWANPKTLKYLSIPDALSFSVQALSVTRHGEKLTAIENEIYSSCLNANEIPIEAASDLFNQGLFRPAPTPSHPDNARAGQNKKQVNNPKK